MHYAFLVSLLLLPAEPLRDSHGDPLPNGTVQRIGTIRLRHSGMVHRAVFSSDGKYLATSGEDGPVRLWEPRTGKLIRQFQGVNQRVYSIAFSPDSKQLTSTGGWPGLSLHIWNVESGAEVHRFYGSGLNNPWDVAWSPDGKLLASGHGQGEATLVLWDPATGKEIRRFRPDKQQAALSIVFTPDSKGLISGSSYGNVQLWDVATGKEIRQICQAKGWAFRVAVSPDGKKVAAAGNDLAVRLWDIETGKELQSFPGKPAPDFPGITGAVHFSKDGKTLITGGMDRTVRFWDIATAKEVRHMRGVPPIAISPDEKTLASTGRDHSLRLWDVATGKEIANPDGPRNDIYSLAVSADGKLTALGVRDEYIRIFETATGKELRHWVGYEYGVRLLRFAPDGKKLLSWGHNAEFWDVASGESLGTLPRDLAFVEPAVYSPDGKWLAFRSGNTDVVVWDVVTKKKVSQFGEEHGLVRGLAFTPDGKTLAVASERNGIALWDPATGKKRLGIKTPDGPQCVAWTPDGKRLVSDGGDRGAIGVWDASTGKLGYSFGGYPDYGTHVMLSPDGRLVASTGPGHAVVLRELATGQVRRRMKGHQEQIAGLAFGPNSRTLVSASRDTTALVWDAYAPFENEARLTTLWDDLASTEADRAHAAIVAALQKPDEAVALLKDKLQATKAVKAETVERWIDQLVDDEPRVRERAVAELVYHADAVIPALRRRLDGKPAPQLRTAIEAVFERFAGPATNPEILREMRAVELLEFAGTRQARAILETLAGGDPGARLTREAKSALGRMK